MRYRDTLNLPKTAFPMRGELPKREPEILARWQEIDLYARIRKAREGRPRYDRSQRQARDEPPRRVIFFESN